jgi:hypothetical protein
MSIRSSWVVPSLTAVLAALEGCGVSLTAAATQVRDTAPELVTGCSFVGTVVGEATPPQGVNDAMKDALNKAAERGATHVVWVGANGGRGPVAMARAYRCSIARAPAAGPKGAPSSPDAPAASPGYGTIWHMAGIAPIR